MNQRIVRLAALAIGSASLAGCGVSGHLSTTPSSPGVYHGSGTVSTTSQGTSSSTPPPSGSHAPSSSSSQSVSSITTHAMTPAFAGTQVQFYRGSLIPSAVPNGYHAPSGQTLTFSSHTFKPIEGFSGILDGRPFVVDFYKDPQGQSVAVNYNHQPVYFGYGPSPVFRVLNFTSRDVVLGNTTAGTYLAINITTGFRIMNNSAAISLKGFTGNNAPSHVLGLNGPRYSSQLNSSGGQ